ncbi:helix-turn-helix domain-containing protein [Cochlodiniinecator piscidefendens]|uniref:helix-turn-helix domain-containing protein n=1 Tax=Cochlodiniinecator piscidefendens TaxID=2715756 RepID=UPI00140BEC3B|nr:helix-turn-helix transcriptional regulator [Cochlodiniinecator piscidefendens]
MEDPGAFHIRLARFIKASGLSNAEICKRVGVSHGFLHPILKGTASPRFATVVKICDVLNITPNQLAGVDKEMTVSLSPKLNNFAERKAAEVADQIVLLANRRLRTGQPTIEDILTWLASTGGVIGETDQFWSYIDLHQVPEKDAMRIDPVSIGSKGLTPKILKTDSIERLNDFIDELPEETRQKLVVEYRQVFQERLSISECTMTVHLPEFDINYDVNYLRLLKPVKDQLGNDLILNFSQPLPSTINRISSPGSVA